MRLICRRYVNIYSPDDQQGMIHILHFSRYVVHVMNILLTNECGMTFIFAEIANHPLRHAVMLHHGGYFFIAPFILKTRVYLAHVSHMILWFR